MFDLDDRAVAEFAAPAATLVIAAGVSVVRVVVSVVPNAPSRVGTE